MFLQSIGKRAFSSCSYAANKPILSPFWASLIVGVLTTNALFRNQVRIYHKLKDVEQELKVISEKLEPVAVNDKK